MIRFYIGDALIYPVEATREQVREGYYIPLLGGSLLLAYEDKGDIWLKMLQGHGGTVYGVEEEGKWAKEIGDTMIDLAWPKGLDQDEAFRESAYRTTEDIGTEGMGKVVTFSEEVFSAQPRATIEPSEANVPVGSTQVLRVVGMPIGQKFFASAEGAEVQVEGDEIKVTPTQHEEHVYVEVSFQGETDSYRLTAVLTPSIVQEDGTEAPVPPEPAEPPTTDAEKVEFSTVDPVERKKIAQVPVLKKVSNRSRGPRESEKLNAYLIGMRHELNELNKREEELRMIRDAELEGRQVAVSMIEDERVVFIDKPVGVRTLRVGVRAERVVSTSVKFNGMSLNSSDYTIDVHGIMTLSDQYTERSGRIEVELTYERHNESEDRLTMDELKRRARRLEERMCQVKEGIENG